MEKNYINFYANCVKTAYEIAYCKVTGRRFIPKKIAGKKKLLSNQSNDFIYNSILSAKPFMAGRYGSVEHYVVIKYIASKMGLFRNIPEKDINMLCNNAGFFPKEIQMVERFCEVMLDANSQIDIIGAWVGVMEDYIIKTYAKNTVVTDLHTLCPYFYENPWSMALEGKKVLVIHPFEETIKSQYMKRELLFENRKILPQFELKTIKAVQTVAGNKCEFKDWFEALEFMTNKAKEEDFDIAIIGCGAYGFPLAANIKKQGKQAIHLGGATQILFGIKGQRWDNDSKTAGLYNNYWVRPSAKETPQGAHKVEGAAYW